VIIKLFGTNGAGKSTIVRAIMRAYDRKIPLYQKDRQKPFGYELGAEGRQDYELFVPGHYEIANGGVDTLRDLDDAYSLIVKHAREGLNVLYEGKNMSDGTKRIVRLRLEQRLDARAILVSYPLADCIRAVRQRGHSIREKTIESLYERSFRDAKVLEDCGVPVEILPRKAAHAKVREWLGLPSVLRPEEELR